MHLTHLSRQEMKQRVMQIMIFRQALFGATFSILRLKYSNANLIICIMAMMAEPNAMEPIWYLRIHLNEMRNDALDFESDAPPYSKYHIQAIAAITN